MTLYEILPLLQGCFAGILIFLILWRGWENPAIRTFAIFLLGMNLWGVTWFGMRLSVDSHEAVWWGRVSTIFIAAASVFFYHFALRYSNTQAKFRSLPIAYLYLAMVIALSPTALVIKGIAIDSYGNTPKLGLMFPLFVAPASLLTAMSVYQLNEARRAAASYSEKNRFLYFVIGGLIALIGGLAGWLSVEGVDIYPGTTLANIIFILLAGVAILRYHLFDIQLATHKVIPYLIMLGLVGVPVMVVYAILNHYWESTKYPLWSWFVAIALIVVFVQILWRWVQYWSEKILYRGRYEQFKALERLWEEGWSIADSPSIETSLPRLISQAMEVSYIYLMLPSTSTGDFKIVAWSGSADQNSHFTLSKDDPIVKWLEAHRTLLHHDSKDIFPQSEALTGQEKKTAGRITGELYVPLSSGERLIGLLILGPKSNQDPYSWEEERLIMRIAGQTALVMENIQLYKASLERESHLAALSRLNKTVSSSLDIQSAYDVFAAELKKIVPVDWATVILIENDELRFFALSTAINSSWGQPGTVINLEGTAVQWLTINKKTLMEPDLSQKRLFWTGEANLKQGIRSIVYLPLFSKGEVFGSFVVGSSVPNAYTQSEIAFLEQVSNQLSLAIENARLYSVEREERARLEAMNNQRDDFLGIISHELKTPLTSIKSSSELLSEELAKDKQATRKRLIENIRRSADRLEVMLNDMLGMVQSRSVSLGGSMRPLDIIPSIKNAVELCSPPIEKKRQKLDVDIPEVLPEVMADPDSLEHILTNLLGNANKFTPRGGKIRFQVKVDDNKIVMDISDSGPGIPVEERELIFEPFYRGEASRSGVKGMGVGLATVRQLVNLHGGTVCVRGDSKTKKGCTFTVCLPLS